MRNNTTFAFVILFSLFLTSCDHVRDLDKSIEKKFNSTPEKNLDSLIHRGVSKGSINDTIFLGYIFGMSERDFNNMNRILYKSGKLYSKSNNICYSMTIEGRDYDAKFSAFFFEDGLYKVGVSIPNKTSKIVLLYDTYKTLSSKYGYPSIIEDSPVFESSDYHWIIGNKHIHLLEGINDVRIYYINESINQDRKQKEESNSKEKSKQTISDI